MAKIILTLGDNVLQEVTLSDERLTIGRGPQNDIVIDDLAVSAEHAVIATVQSDTFFEDLGSTNGSRINGQSVKKHFLQDGDAIELARYKIQYISPSEETTGHDGQRKESMPISEQTDRAGSPAPAGSRSGAVIRVLDGSSAGKELRLTKVLNTLGKPGVQVAVISQRAQGYYLSHVEGISCPLVNGQSIGAEAHRMVYGDIIEVSGIKLAFLPG